MKLKSLFISFVLIISVFASSAQEIWTTQQGDLKIFPIRHASMVWEWNGLTIYIDPVGDATSYAMFNSPDVVLITHSHGDHLSTNTLAGIKAEKASFVVPQEVAEKLDDKFKKRIHIIENHESIELVGMEIEAVPAYNYPVTDESWHIKGLGNGYVITLGGKRIYISGDTGNMPEMKEIDNLDAAFLCMNLPYTMDVDDAAKATLTIQPRIIYPYHYRGKNGFSDLEKFKSLVAAENTEIEVRVLDWYGK